MLSKSKELNIQILLVVTKFNGLIFFTVFNLRYNPHITNGRSQTLHITCQLLL